MKTIYVIRHGRTILNKYDKMQGWCDSPLIPEGIAVAKKAGEELANIPFDAAFSSDAKRASDTAQFIIERNVNRDKLELVQSMFFREAFYGYFEGMGSPEAWFLSGGPHGYKEKEDLVAVETFDTAKDYMKAADPYHDAEDAKEYWERVDQGLELIKNLPDSVENILLVTHGNTISSLTDRFGQGKFDLTVGPKNSSITTMTYDGDEFVITSYNQMHLPKN